VVISSDINVADGSASFFRLFHPPDVVIFIAASNASSGCRVAAFEFLGWGVENFARVLQECGMVQQLAAAMLDLATEGDEEDDHYEDQAV
jgi:dTDP-4-dehydrorhamnose reductase